MIPQRNTAGSRRKVDVKSEDVLRVVRRHGRAPGYLVAILSEIQETYRYLPEKALRIISEETKTSLVDVYGTATFYRFFSLKPKGTHVISVCTGTACHVRGGRNVVEELKRRLGVNAGETTPDGKFTLDTVNCLGACALGPIVAAHGRHFSNVSAAKVAGVIQAVRSGRLPGQDGDALILDVSCPHCGVSLMDSEVPLDGHPSIQLLADFGRETGSARVSSIYGQCVARTERAIPRDATVVLHCPHCRRSVMGPPNCLECGAPMARLAVRGGAIGICSRCGCDGHTLDVNGRCHDMTNTPKLTAKKGMARE